MNGLQKVLTGILPGKWARDAEEESRNWVFTCSCGSESSVWDAGGIRWGAAGNPVRFMKCPSCGWTGIYRIFRKDLGNW